MRSRVIAALARHAAERPSEPALHDAAGTWTWAELWYATAALAAQLGGGHARRVLAVAENGRGLATALLAALASGAELMCVSPRTPRAARVELAERIGASRVLAEDPAVAEAERLDPLGTPRARDASVDSSGAGALLLATSGTSGPPRIARRSARAVDFIAHASAHALALGPSDRVLIAVPLFHSYGIDQLGAALLSGSFVELHASFNPAAIGRSLAERGITHLPAVPAMLDALARAAGPSGPPPALRSVCSAGSPLPVRVAEAFRARFALAPRELYGASELGTIAISEPGEATGCVGRPLAGVAIRILERGAPEWEKPLQVGEEGVVAVATPGCFDGYLEGGAGGGTFVTGDLGHVDARGALWLNGRVGLLIDVGAVKVNPLEVEAVLMRHPAVREAVVLPLAFAETAARLRAVVVPEPGAAPSREELRRFAREHLIDFKVPRAFEIRDCVPRSPSGKILRAELARLFPSGRDEE